MFKLLKEYIVKSNIFVDIFVCILLLISFICGLNELSVIGSIFVVLLFFVQLLIIVLKILMLLGVLSDEI